MQLPFSLWEFVNEIWKSLVAVSPSLVSLCVCVCDAKGQNRFKRVRNKSIPKTMGGPLFLSLCATSRPVVVVVSLFLMFYFGQQKRHWFSLFARSLACLAGWPGPRRPNSFFFFFNFFKRKSIDKTSQQKETEKERERLDWTGLCGFWLRSVSECCCYTDTALFQHSGRHWPWCCSVGLG